MILSKKEVDEIWDSSKNLMEFVDGVEQAVLAKSSTAPKQEPVGWVGVNSSGDKFLIAGGPDGKDWEFFNPFPVYDHPTPPQAAAIPEFDMDLVIAVLEDYAYMQTSGFVPTANRYPASNVMEQVEALSAAPKPEAIRKVAFGAPSEDFIPPELLLKPDLTEADVDEWRKSQASPTHDRKFVDLRQIVPDGSKNSEEHF